VERLELCSEDGYYFNIAEAELREDLISLPLGAKIQFQRLKIGQKLTLLRKVKDARISGRPVALLLDTNLVYTFDADQELTPMDAADLLRIVLGLYDDLFNASKIISRQWWQLQQSLRQYLQRLNTRSLLLVTDFISKRVGPHQW